MKFTAHNFQSKHSFGWRVVYFLLMAGAVVSINYYGFKNSLLEATLMPLPIFIFAIYNLFFKKQFAELDCREAVIEMNSSKESYLIKHEDIKEIQVSDRELVMATKVGMYRIKFADYRQSDHEAIRKYFQELNKRP